MHKPAGSKQLKNCKTYMLGRLKYSVAYVSGTPTNAFVATSNIYNKQTISLTGTAEVYSASIRNLNNTT
jgi:hypothetical protein